MAIDLPVKDWMLPGDPPEFARYKDRAEALLRQARFDNSGYNSGYMTDDPALTDKEMVERGLWPWEADPIPALEPKPPIA